MSIYLKELVKAKKECENKYGMTIYPLRKLEYVNGTKEMKPMTGFTQLTLEKSKQINLFKVQEDTYTFKAVAIAMLCGKESNIMVFDVDFDIKDEKTNGEIIDTLPYQFRDILQLDTPIIKTRKGYHIYFEYDSDYKQRDKVIYNNTKYDIDLLTENKKGSMLPPTAYQLQDGTAFQYKWIKDIKDYKPMKIPDFIKVILQNYSKKHIEMISASRLVNEGPKILVEHPSYDIISSIIFALPEKYYDIRPEWYNVCQCLKNIGGDDLRELAREFSEQSDSYYNNKDSSGKADPEGEFDTFWESIRVNETHEQPLTFNSLKGWLKKDNPEEYYQIFPKHVLPDQDYKGLFNKVSKKLEFEFDSRIERLLPFNPKTIKNKQVDGNNYRFNAEGKCLCGLEATEFYLYTVTDSKNNHGKNIIMKCNQCKSNGKLLCPLTYKEGLGQLPELTGFPDQIDYGVIDKDNIYLTDKAKFNMTSTELTIGSLSNYLINNADINIMENLGTVFTPKYDISSNKWNCKFESQNSLVLYGNEESKPCIRIERTNPKSTKMIASFERYHGSKPFQITKKEDMNLVLTAVDDIIKQYLTGNIGLSSAIINFNININQKVEPRVVEGIIIKEMEQHSLLDNFIIKSANEIYEYDEDSGLWEERKNNEVSEKIIELYQENFGHSLTQQDISYLESANTLSKVHTKFTSSTTRNKRDKRRAALLDANPYLFPFNNLVYDLENSVLREIQKTDYLTTTTGYNIRQYDEIPVEEHEIIKYFYETILPIHDEREFFKNLVASCLPKTTKEKILVILTDRREGNNGKSTLMDAICGVYGKLAHYGDFSLLTDQSSSMNGHDAGLFQYKDKRLTFIDETDNSKVISSSRTKKITSGGKNKISGRKFMSGEYEEFEWTATPFVNCNDGEFAKINASDSALLARLKVVPFRSKFLPRVKDNPKTYTYCINSNIVDRVNELKDVHFYYLLDAYRNYRINGIIQEPEYSIVYKESLIQAADSEFSAICEFIDDACVFTENTGDYIQRKTLIDSLKQKQPRLYNNCGGLRRIEAKFDKCMRMKGIKFVKEKEYKEGEKTKIHKSCYLGLKEKIGGVI